MRKLQEEREEYIQRIEQLERIILTSSKTQRHHEASVQGLHLDPRGSFKSGTFGRARAHRARSCYTMPKSFFQALAKAPMEADYREKEDEKDPTSAKALNTFEFKPQLNSGENNMAQVSKELAEMKNTIQDLKQQLKQKDNLIKKMRKEVNKLRSEVEERDEALKEWEAFWQAESNVQAELDARGNGENGVTNNGPESRKSDLLATADADFGAPLVQI
mmetsp:Transcript_8540/g.13497  ORF Transcript_8540/g.13497 Transcript_8540/m.13497 type:complete len:218 (+) Transcript_8540:363-1016(+)